MADKKSLAEAIASIRRQKKIVKKSIAGIERTFDVSAKPETKALTSYEGTAIMNPVPEMKPLQPLRRKLRPVKSKPEPEPEPIPVAEPVMEEKKEEPVVEEKKEKKVKDKVAVIEKKPAKYRYKRNDQNTLFL